MNKIKKVINKAAALLLCVPCVSLVACDTSDGGKNEVKIWSTYNTLKVLRDYAGPPESGGAYPDLGKKLEVKMCLGETEGAQLMVTPKKAVRSAKLTAGDLTNENGSVLSKEDIDVYYQYYLYVENKTKAQNNFNYPAAWTPDMILPMDICVANGENKIAAGKNQGFTVEFTTTSDTDPGTYTGNFSLSIDGEVTTIPVTVEVMGVDITKSHGKSMIMTGSTAGRMNGEYNTTTYYKNYYETSLYEYDFCCDYVPGSTDPVVMPQSVLHYWDHPNFTSYCIPTSTYTGSSAANHIKKGELFEYIYQLAIASTPEKLLLDKAYLFTPVDEPEPSEYDECLAAVQAVYEVEEQVVEYLEKEGFYEKAGYDAEYRAILEDSILTLPIVQTSTYTQALELGSDINTHCSHLHAYGSSAARETYYSVREGSAQRGGEAWYYTCMYPIYPHPTDHLDDYLIGGRIMRWMQKDYDLDGYLHWAFFRYYVRNGSTNTDPYSNAERFPGTMGDGFKTYPGYKYGLDTYIPSIRLAAFRDGQEDYDLLCKLDEIIAENEAYYGVTQGTVDARMFIADIYEKMYTGTVYNQNDAEFYQLRDELFDVVKLFGSESKFLVTKEESATEIKSNIYLANGYTVNVNGSPLTPSGSAGAGNKYEITQSRDNEIALDIQIIKDGVVVDTLYLFLSGATHTVDLSATTVFTTSENGSVTYADGVLTATLKSKDVSDDIIAALTYVPYLRISSVGVSLTEVNSLSITLTNKGTQDVTLKTRFKSGAYTYDLQQYKIAAGETRTIVIEGVYAYETLFGVLSSAAFELYTDNTSADGSLLPDSILAISEIAYDIKRGNV